MSAVTIPPSENKKRSDGQFSLPVPKFLRNVKNISAISQLIFFLVALFIVMYLTVNVYQSMVEKGFPPNFTFLGDAYRNEIPEAPDWYSPTSSSVIQGYAVGVINTLRVVIPGLFLSTLLGVMIGIALLSRNFMVKTVSASYVELLRNTPLLVQLFFWYFVVMFSLPTNDATFPSEGVFVLPLRLIAYPIVWVGAWILARRHQLPKQTLTAVFVGAFMVEIAIGLLGYGTTPALVVGVACMLLFVASYFHLIPEAYHGWGLGIGLVGMAQGVGMLVISLLVSANILPAPSIFWDVYPVLYATRKGFILPEIGERGFLLPQKSGFKVSAGTQFTPEYTSLFVGLIIYTSAFIGEIVRAGIQAVPYGQMEASRALGLSGFQTLRLVVLPQALRVIIPPLTNQYLNLAKNSTLASAVAFGDTYTVALSIMNLTGQGVTGFIIIMIIYLVMSLIISLIMNIINSRFQIVTR